MDIKNQKELSVNIKNVVDTTIEEMISVEIGCPYGPRRKTKADDSS